MEGNAKEKFCRYLGTLEMMIFSSLDRSRKDKKIQDKKKFSKKAHLGGLQQRTQKIRPRFIFWGEQGDRPPAERRVCGEEAGGQVAGHDADRHAGLRDGDPQQAASRLWGRTGLPILHPPHLLALGRAGQAPPTAVTLPPLGNPLDRPPWC